MAKTIWDYLTDAGETMATLGTGAVAPFAGGAYGIYKGVTSPNYGTIQGGREADRAAIEMTNRLTYQPRGEATRGLLGAVGGAVGGAADFLRLPPVLPEAAILGALGLNNNAIMSQTQRGMQAAKPMVGNAMESYMARTGLAPRMMPEGGLLGDKAFDVSKADASDIFGAGAQKTTYKDPESGGYIQVLTRPDQPASVTNLEVPEAFRKHGVGGKLQAQASKDFPNMQGQVSSKAAAKSAYKLGRRPVGQPSASRDEVLKAIDDNSSVNLVSPARQQEIGGSQGGLLSTLSGKPKIKAAPQAKALELPRQRAALPIDEGGLGLPEINTPEMRAEAMGARDWYHGTDRLDRLVEKQSFDPKRATSGPMPYGTDDKSLASSYTGKADTSLFDTGEVQNYFQTSNKNVGRANKGLTNVEDSYYSLPAEKKKELLDNYYKVGYKNIDEADGDYVLHAGDGSIASKKHLDFVLKDSAGNPLKALRQLWHDSGQLYGKEEDLAKIYKVAGYPHDITQTNAPWTSAKGVFAGKAMFRSPLETSNVEALQSKVIPALKDAFKADRTKLQPFGADDWDKNTRFTPKQWVEELERDLAQGKNSYVWTSIPDKVTKQLEKLGYDSIVDVSGKGGGTQSNVLIPFKPNQIRSQFAAFDPMRRDEPNLLAGALPLIPAGAAGSNGLLDQFRGEQQ